MNKKDSAFTTGKLDDDTGFLVLQISRLWEFGHERVLKKHHNISHIQYAVLATVYWLSKYDKDREITQSYIAKHTKIDPMTVSQVSKILEGRGYIQRQVCPTDVRAKVLSLTREGNELVERAIPFMIDFDSKFFGILGKNIKNFNKYLSELLYVNDY